MAWNMAFLKKNALHVVVGGIMSKLTSGDFLAGATAAGINKLVIEEIDKVADGDPDKAQWVSAVLGAVIIDLVSGNAQAGASVAASGLRIMNIQKRRRKNLWNRGTNKKFKF